MKIDLKKIEVFHTDRGREFDNKLNRETLETFEIKHSPSSKEYPYDNVVAEATFKIIKTELVNLNLFFSLKQLSVEWFDYVNWYNNHRVHGTLGYLTTVEFRGIPLKKVVKKTVAFQFLRIL